MNPLLGVPQLRSTERKVGELPLNRKELNPDSSPQAAFGARVRTSREARGWTQEELSQRMGYSSTHISSVETGYKMPTLRFSRSADRVFGSGASDTFERQARAVRHGNLLQGFPEYVKYESRAVEIRAFEIGIIPGLLQTPEYATILAEAAVKRGAINEEAAFERITTVADRQAALDRQSPPQVFVVMDESCIRRPIGEPAVMKAQLGRLLEFAEQPDNVLQIAPFEMGVHRTLDQPIYILTMADRSLVSYAESAHRGNFDRDSAFAAPFLRTYHQLQAEAASQATSVAMIEQLRKGIP